MRGLRSRTFGGGGGDWMRHCFCFFHEIILMLALRSSSFFQRSFLGSVERLVEIELVLSSQYAQSFFCDFRNSNGRDVSNLGRTWR